MKKQSKKMRYCYDLACDNCGMSITVKSKNECPGSDILFVCCGDAMKVKK